MEFYGHKRMVTARVASLAVLVFLLLIAGEADLHGQDDEMTSPSSSLSRYRSFPVYETMTPAERDRLYKLHRSGQITRADLPIFFERFSRAPNRENAFDQALDSSFGARAAREWADIKEATPIIGDAGIGIEATEQHFAEHGFGKGLYKIAESAVTAPFCAWGRALSDQGLGERPLRTLVALLLGALICSKILMHLGRVVMARIVRPFILPLPNIFWQFTLDRVQELSRVMRGEE